MAYVLLTLLSLLCNGVWTLRRRCMLLGNYASMPMSQAAHVFLSICISADLYLHKDVCCGHLLDGGHLLPGIGSGAGLPLAGVLAAGAPDPQPPRCA